MKKVCKILFIVTVLLVIFSVSAYAGSGVNPGSYTGGGANVSSITSLGNKIIQIVSTIGSIVSVIILVVLGVKYMMGSAEEKAEYKKTLLPYIIGAALVFAASSIAAMVFNFTQNL